MALPAAVMFRLRLLTVASKPKALLFHGAFLPQFIDPARALLPQFVIVAGTFVVVAFAVEYGLTLPMTR